MDRCFYLTRVILLFLFPIFRGLLIWSVLFTLIWFFHSISFLVCQVSPTCNTSLSVCHSNPLRDPDYSSGGSPTSSLRFRSVRVRPGRTSGGVTTLPASTVVRCPPVYGWYWWSFLEVPVRTLFRPPADVSSVRASWEVGDGG